MDVTALQSSILQVFIACVLAYSAWKFLFKKREKAILNAVAIVVLGDIGRSPRMMYHAESFAKHQFETYLIGYKGSQPLPSLLSLPHVRFMYLTEIPSVFTRLPFILLAPLKIALQVATILLTLLFWVPHPPEFIMAQNPPSIPTLALVWFVCKVRGSKLIIDWHNLGYSILALRLGRGHILVKLAEKFEATFGRTAYIHLFVTNAMRDYLVKEWDLQGRKVVLHDRPPAHFHRASAFETHDLLLRLRTSFSSPTLSSFLPRYSTPRSTPLTQLSAETTSLTQSALQPQILDPVGSALSNTGLPELRPDRPALLVSSTSWTPDEDFGLLLEALQQYERLARLTNDEPTDTSDADGGVKGALPKVLMIVTGKGPLKKKYMDEVARLEQEENWQYVRCRSLWLEAKDYPLLLGSADLGISLHSSSSALDLPMKVVDMFGCGLPVCALDFDCLSELVKENENGLVFKTAEELTQQLEILLKGFPRSPKLDLLRKSLRRKPTSTIKKTSTVDDDWEWCTWAENWDKVLRPLVLRDVDGDHQYEERVQ